MLDYAQDGKCRVEGVQVLPLQEIRSDQITERKALWLENLSAPAALVSLLRWWKSIVSI